MVTQFHPQFTGRVTRRQALTLAGRGCTCGVPACPSALISAGRRVCSVGTDSRGAGEEAGGKEQRPDPGRQLVSEGSLGPQELIWLGAGPRHGFPDCWGSQETCPRRKTENLFPYGFSAGSKAVCSLVCWPPICHFLFCESLMLVHI